MHEDCTPTHGYAAPREAAMAAFAKSWRWENQRRGASRAGNSATVASPGPAPRRLLRCHPAGWQSGRGGLSTSATVGRGDRGEAATPRDLDRPRELFVMLRQVPAPTQLPAQSAILVIAITSRVQWPS
jgi:hypothetical protein